MSIEYPITRHGLPIQLARELMREPNEDRIVEALRSAYATGYTEAIARLEPNPEWDSDRIAVSDSRIED